MPGRVLVIDPNFTERVMLKSQLSSQYFAVDVAVDFAECRKVMHQMMPDAIVLNYHAEAETGFANCRRLKSGARTAHIPILLMCQSIEDTFWNSVYRLEVDEVLPMTPDGLLLGCRLAQLIRTKDAREAERQRQKTYRDLGFAEPAVQFPTGIHIGVLDGSNLVSPESYTTLKTLLQKTFPKVEFSEGGNPECDLLIVDGTDEDLETALVRLCAEKRKVGPQTQAPKILFLSPISEPGIFRRCLELGADDCAGTDASSAEIATRIRAMAWRQQAEWHASKTVNDRLRLAMQDPLTEVFNRRYAEEHLDRLLRDKPEDNGSVAVMMLDIDNFKRVNDRYGHEAGDTVIKETARRLGDNLRSSDLIARIGGEEFLVVLQDTPQEQALKIAERMCKKINFRAFQVEGSSEPISVTISIGVTFAQQAKSSKKTLLNCADKALHFSKETGRNRVTFLNAAA